MNRHILGFTFAFLTIVATPLFAFAAKDAFGFNARSISGIPNGGSVSLTGGGAYALPDFVHSGGSFSCLTPVNNGPLRGCGAGEGVRWDTARLLPSTNFKCI